MYERIKTFVESEEFQDRLKNLNPKVIEYKTRIDRSYMWLTGNIAMEKVKLLRTKPLRISVKIFPDTGDDIENLAGVFNQVFEENGYPCYAEVSDYTMLGKMISIWKKENNINMQQITIKSIGKYQTEVHRGNGTVVLISYETPVAACIDNRYYRTSKYHSPTTERHIEKWLGEVESVEEEQEFFDNLMKEHEKEFWKKPKVRN